MILYTTWITEPKENRVEYLIRKKWLSTSTISDQWQFTDIKPMCVYSMRIVFLHLHGRCYLQSAELFLSANKLSYQTPK